MTNLSDIEIANQVEMNPITDIAEKLGIPKESLALYGDYKAKINVSKLENLDKAKRGKLILVTAITPTPAGEGKTTTSVGLVDALTKIGKKAAIALREPSLGPVFGVKGGAAGGGYAQVVPMEDINLHFTGDFHAIGAANNLLAALLDNHIHQGNALGIDSRRITWKRVVDMNDRQLRHIVNGLQGRINGVPREDGYDITVASEIMAVLCLANNITDLKEKLKKIIVAYSFEGTPITAGDLKAEGAMTALLKEAIQPNIVQTLEHSPAFIHGGPFANIAHGCNSVLATKLALQYADYAVTEAGFGADLGAEKFIDIKCRLAELKPDAVVLVATIRALKMHGGMKKADLGTESVEAVLKGLPNLEKHLSNIQEVYGMPVVVAINKFPTDTDAELAAVEKACEERNVEVTLSDVWAKGSEGGIDLANKVIELAEKPNSFSHVYDLSDSIEEKLTKIVQRVYGGKGIELAPSARKELAELEKLGFTEYPICMAKTQYSFSDDATLLGAPKDFTVTIRNLKVSAGAGFIVALTGAVMTMPGLPKSPAAERIDVDAEGNISGLF
ncbi:MULTISPECIES: formate--tetrahydrofolate ligase [Enterococcus]|uniref:Formate--tetrahydrofolate ligase n=1 Tax=Enterococcus thailandicus TaxID=417368 RepID=A0A179EQE9_ENTTH|nr:MULTISPECIES: formate--tetrahydrofolate ligase [Enterococcus]MDA3964844.1 formate--tetrahydrofolate ligase [Enterococcus thailandicus]MDK4351297.1 formate--tetrahydrofolate ligase [Enterococcus thailandicus]MDT2732970.1 formate--tetrahydrofolate ligase [Enterococcus thailandicus]MDT2752078.1 formate--tetrahydrofolate ligase [Enterococcus thailandicus]MDT2777044.1 formate--tetrahydrofolate ligase [Enterococcus thailandicus]